jgi:hypothetical protein
MTTVYLPLALISLWGDDGTSRPATARFSHILDHTMALVSGVTIACLRTMTEAHRTAYRRCMALWIGGLQNIHPESNNRVNGHMSLHIYDFLCLFGPVHSWWCFPFERLIGQLQRLPTNHRFGTLSAPLYKFSFSSNQHAGELEPTLLRSFLHAAKLRQWIGRQDCPGFIKECKMVFDRAFAIEKVCVGVDTLPSLAYGPVPKELRGLIKEHEIAFRAQRRAGSVVFARSSTHLGNSLILFYPGGDTCLELVPGSIQHIVSPVSKPPFYIVRRQLPLPSPIVDPLIRYPYFKAKIYSSEMGVDLEIVYIDWVVSHYARWNVTSEHSVVLNLSRV